MNVPDTLGVVSENSRRYDERCADAAREALRHFVAERGSQAAAAEALAKTEGAGSTMDQGTVSRAIAKDKQPSLRVLIALSRATGRTLDEILGLKHGVPSMHEVAVEAAVEAIRRMEAAQSTVPPSTTGVREVKRKGLREP